MLRAASALGGTFWPGAVATMLGEDVASVSREIARLVDAELVEPRNGGRFPGEREHAFRHGVAREAAYAMLTAEDRASAHRRAAQWLDAHGEPDAGVIAYHHEAGGRPDRAVSCWLKAAEAALEAIDLERAASCADRGLAGGAEGHLRGVLLLRRAQAHSWLGDQQKALDAAREAKALLATGSDEAAVVVAEASLSALRLGRTEEVVALAREASGWLRGQSTPEPVLVQAARVATALFVSERPDLVRLGQELLSQIEEHASHLEDDRALRPRVLAARVRAPEVAERPEAQALLWASLAGAMEEVGDLRTAIVVRAGAELMLWEIGDRDGCVERLRALVGVAEQLGHGYVASAAMHTLGMVLVDQGDLEAGMAIQANAVDVYTRGDRRMEAASRMTLAIALKRRGWLPAAEHEAKTAVALAEPFPGVASAANAILADILVTTDPAAALAASTTAYELLEAIGGVMEWGEALVRRVHAEVLIAHGQIDEARDVIARARDRLLRRAGTFSDPDRRAAYLNRVTEHVRTLELADQWLDRDTIT
ncbi:MAG: hypothetical protein IT379_42345 [Deltaproteobacteria bacterium]|nr:hypothetical protein [Deltaproteobacteria bacterium]